MKKTITYFIVFYLFFIGYLKAENTEKSKVPYPKFILLVQEKDAVITRETFVDFIMSIYNSFGKHFSESKAEPKDRHEDACKSTLMELGLLEKRGEIEKFFRTMFLYSDDKEYQIGSFRYFTLAGNLSKETIKAINDKIKDPKTEQEVLDAIYLRISNLSTPRNELVFPKEVSVKIFRSLSHRLLTKDKDKLGGEIFQIAKEILPSCWNEKEGQEILDTTILIFQKRISEKGSRGLSLSLSNIVTLEDKLKKKIDVPITEALVMSLMSIPKDADFKTKALESQGLMDMDANEAFSDKSFDILEQAIKKANDRDIKILLIKSTGKYKNEFIISEAFELFKSEPINTMASNQILGYFELQKDKRIIATLVDKVKVSPFKTIEEKMIGKKVSSEINRNLNENSEGWYETVLITRNYETGNVTESKILFHYPEKILALTIQRIIKAKYDVQFSSPEEAKKIVLDWWEKNKDNKEYYFEKK